MGVYAKSFGSARTYVAAPYSGWTRADYPSPLRLRRPCDGPVRLIAATDSVVLAGFRQPAAIAADLEALAIPGFTDLVTVLRRPDQGEAILYSLGLLLATGRTAQISLTSRAVWAAAQRPEPALGRLAGLQRHHGDDPGLLVSLFLEKIILSPGDVLQVSAGMVYMVMTGRTLQVARVQGQAITVGLSLEPVAAGAVLQRLDSRIGPAYPVPGVGLPGVLRYPSSDGVALTQVVGRTADLLIGSHVHARALTALGWSISPTGRQDIDDADTDLTPGRVQVGGFGRVVVFGDQVDLG